MSYCQQIRRALNNLLHYIIHKNLFASIPPTTDTHKRRNQMISTYLYVILLFLTFSILLVYNSAITISKTATVKDPSAKAYSKLFQEYSATLSCPCKNISIDYGKFLQIKYKLHQLCYSSFVSETWIGDATLMGITQNVPAEQKQLLLTITAIFRVLRSMCMQVNHTISYDLSRFYTSQYVSIHLVSTVVLQSQFESMVNQYRNWMISEFLSSLNMTRKIIETNSYYSHSASNGLFFVEPHESFYKRYSFLYDGCSCDSSALCTTSVKIFENDSSNALYSVPGMRIGCYLFEAALQSDLRCFYDRTCFDELASYIHLDQVFNFTLLDASATSLFHPNTTMKVILDELMIETWNWSISYEDYFKACHPTECSYVERTKNDILYVLTTMIGLIGGLTTALRLIVPHLVWIVRRKKANRGENRTAFNLKVQLRQWLHNFNLFASTPPSTDRRELINQKISTYSFIVLFIIALSVILAYLSTNSARKTVHVKQPNFIQYKELQDKHLQTLVCPCSKPVVKYKQFLHINYSLHQVCSSDFVSQSWIGYIEESGRVDDIASHDFRRVGPFMFQGLHSLCEQIENTLANGIAHLNLTDYISMELTPIKLFESRFNSIFKQFQILTTNEFLSALSPAQDISHSNNLLSAIQTNYYLYLLPGRSHITIGVRTYNSCSCLTSQYCTEPAHILLDSTEPEVHTIDGLRTGCYAFESLLQSNLKCLFNQICFDALLSLLSTNQSQFNGKIMNASSSSRFHLNTTINELLQELMMESWNSSIMYENYYMECHPVTCRYTVRIGSDVTYLVSTAIGLIGGLITALQLIVPRAVKLINRRKVELPDETGTTQNRPVSLVYIHKLWQRIYHLNIFPSTPPTTDQYKLRSQRISTYFFITTLACSFSILLIYASIVPTTKSITVAEPTLTRYLELHAKHSETLNCPCRKISVNYDKILNVDYTFHPICSDNVYIDNWLNHLMRIAGRALWNPYDFRVVGIFMLKSLKSLCKQVNTTISNSIIRFNNNQYVSVDLTPYALFESQVESFFDQLRSSTTARYLSSLRLIRDITHENHLYPTTQMNQKIIIAPNTAFSQFAIIKYPNNCICLISSSCIRSIPIFEGLTMQVLHSLPGVYYGCYILEALLQSNLNCLFYNRTCFNEIMYFTRSKWLFNQTVIDSSIPSRFFPNSTVSELLNNLMVEKWNRSIFYEKYFDECRPTECTYIVKQRNDAIYIVTTTISLVGGLNTALQLIIPPFIHFIRYLWRKRTRVVPVNTTAIIN